MGNQCNETVGAGAVSYLCRLEAGHLERDGSPHRAPEHGPSNIAYAKWERERRQEAEAKVPDGAEVVEMTPDEIEVAPVDGEAVPGPFSNQKERLAMALQSLVVPFEEMPQPVRSWVRGAEAQLALVELWTATKNGPVTISRAVLADIVPEHLQVD